MKVSTRLDYRLQTFQAQSGCQCMNVEKNSSTKKASKLNFRKTKEVAQTFCIESWKEFEALSFAHKFYHQAQTDFKAQPFRRKAPEYKKQ